MADYSGGCRPFLLLSAQSFLLPSKPDFSGVFLGKRRPDLRKDLRVSRWKQILPDGSIVAKSRGFRKKKLQSFTFEYLERFMVESCRAEMTHLLAILPFWVFWFFTPPYVPWMMLVYALIVNIPCIIVQRYNRPRIMRILQKRESMSVTREDR